MAVPAPVVVELHQPQGVAVVEAVDVAIVDIDPLRVLVESNKAGAERVLNSEAGGQGEERESGESCQHDGERGTKADSESYNPREVGRQLGFVSD